MIVEHLRLQQKEILKYRSGKMGISAVPGSGKTWTLSLLAAEIIADGVLGDDQEVLIVTLVNSAVDNFYQRVSSFLREAKLIPHMGYRVRTLHGLAHDIVRERPYLVGLEDNFQILDERETDRILSQVTQSWLLANPGALDDYLSQDLPEGILRRVRTRDLPELLTEVATAFVRTAKNYRLSPEQLRQKLDHLAVPLPLAEMGYNIYVEYQQALAYRGAVDFDDLIILALQALENDGQYLERLRYRWPYILEDEAQDSNRLQEQILEKLVGEGGNWVRVGDPNQAIYETFTTASPRFLREFIRRKDVLEKRLSASGRSTKSIIYLANTLVKWTQKEHPVPAVRDALHSPPLIRPTKKGDPQPNPADDPTKIYLVLKKYSPKEEIQEVVKSLVHWLPKNSQATVAVLVPTNSYGFQLVQKLDESGIPYEDSLLSSSASTRTTAGTLGKVLRYLSSSGNVKMLDEVFQVWVDSQEDGERDIATEIMDRAHELLRKLSQAEDFLAPGPSGDWLDVWREAGEDERTLQLLGEFRQAVQRWHAAVLLPIDQLVLTLTQDLIHEASEFAVAHKLALLLRQASQAHPQWRLSELCRELEVISRNERRFLGFSKADIGFNPDDYKGIVVVSTMHKAKGLEWDRVYLMSVNNYDFPSAQDYDLYKSEIWFLRDKLNLQAETLEQLETALSTDEYAWYEQGVATQRARLDYVRERLRLFYVCITRAKKELIVTYNTGKMKNVEMRPSIPFLRLYENWKERIGEA